MMKEMLEGAAATAKTQLHLDRCLTCRACETTCPSGVQYGRLVDIGRKLVAQRVPRSLAETAKRRALAAVVPSGAVFNPLLKLGQLARPMLPAVLRDKVPVSARSAGPWPAPRHARKMLALAGCVQPTLAPDINASTARVLDKLGISLIEARGAGCCGAVRYHLDFQAEGLDDMRRLIDLWWPHLEAGVEAIVMTASGCGSSVKEYGHLLARDPRYAAKAKRISASTKDLAEVLEGESVKLRSLGAKKPGERIAFHPPCSLQHGQQIKGVAENILRDAGFDLTPVQDEHLCCGSAGTYSMLQPEIAGQLKKNKLAALQAGSPQLIATANIGCLTHLASGTPLPTVHWVQALEQRLG